ncbi:tape measure protein [Virgibacillus siamensis]|uniref:tape measure protein n=2 Tax=Bacillati TaxID=1783272 RepID=UPI0036319830
MGVKDISKTMTLKDGVTGPLRRIGEGTVRYKNQLRELQAQGAQTWASIKSGATAAIAVMATAGTAMMGVGISANSSAEAAEKSFGILLNSASAAAKMVADLKELAVKSPFEFAGLQEAAKTMMGMGFAGDQVVPMLYSLGNAVAAVGGSTEEMKGIALAIGQIQAKGKLSAEEVNQLAERGVPAWQLLAKEMGKTPAQLMKLAEEGKLLSNQVIPLLMKGLNERFDGAMDEMSDTFQYTVANIKETATQQLAGVTKPLFDEIKKDLQGIQSTLSSDGVTTWGSRFSTALVSIYNGAKAVANAVFSVSSFIVNNWSYISPIVYGVVGAFAAYHLILIGTKVWTLANVVYTNLLTVAHLGLNAAIRANPMGWLITLIGLAVAAGTYLINNWEQVKLTGMNTWNVVVSAAEWAVNKYVDFANFMIRTYMFAWDSIEFAGKSIWNGILTAGEAGVNSFIGLIETMVQKAIGGVNSLISGVNKISGELGIGPISELSFNGLGRVNFSGAKAAAEKPKWNSSYSPISKMDFSNAQFSSDAITAQTRKVQAERDKKIDNVQKDLMTALNNNTAALASNTAETNNNTGATTKNTKATNKNTEAVLKGNNNTAMDIADSLLQRIERHIWSTS